MTTLEVNVAALWSRLAAMEAEKRFGGSSYPETMCAFPFQLRGQGFFPGGDGLWREDDRLHQPSSGVLPLGGIMFVGNDFGPVTSYEKLRKKRYENPWTWRNLKRRIRMAGLPTTKVFATNAMVGLRTSEKALEKKNWECIAGFSDFCREFFIFQVETMKPRLVVMLGPIAQNTIAELLHVEIGIHQSGARARVGSHSAPFLYSPHPYPDHMSRDEEKMRSIVEALGQAWNLAE